MSQEANYSVTVKTLKGNLVTVRGDTADEWKANLEAASTSGALGVIKQIEAGLAAAAAAQPAEPAKPAQELPQGFTNPPCSTCGGATEPHPTKHEGTSPQSGKPYKRYVCTTSQLHKNTFINA